MLDKTRWLDTKHTRRAGRCIPALALLLLLGLGALSLLGRGETPTVAHEHSRAPGDGLAPRAPNPWFFAERSYPVGRIDREALQRGRLQAAEMRAAARSESGRSGEWTPRGPLNVGGRITALAVDPRDDTRVYAAAAEGGILRSEDAGQHWTPLFDQGASLAMGAVALDPNDPDIVYAGSGEVNPGGGSVAYGGAGLFRSLDRGETWSSIGLEESGAIGRICVDPSDPDRVFVAAMGQLWEADPHRGVYRTTNGGAAWELVLFVAEDTGCVDLIQNPDQPDLLFAAMWQRMRQTEAYDYGGPECAVYRSDDGGDSWTLVSGTGGLPAPSSQGGRIGLSLCAADPGVICAVYADRTGYFDGLYRSINGGSSWTQTNDGALSGVFASYGWWFGNVRVHPSDPLTIFVLGLGFYRSTNGGSSWSSAAGGMHVDHHALAFGPGANPVMYEGNDGGVYRSGNGGTAWSKLPNLPVTQIYRLALDAGNPNVLYLGAQDNGTNKSLGALDDFDNIYGGDGFGPLVHPTNSQQVWALYQYGGLGYSSNGGGSFSGATGGTSGRVAWNAPLVQDPTDADRRYFGTDKVFRSASNTSWTAVSGDLTGGPHQGNAGQVRGTLTALGVSSLDGQVLWAGSDDGVVSVSENGGSSWTDVSAGLPVRWITSIRPDPFDRETAYLTVSGFRWAESAAHLFKTGDLGASWQPIGAGLPDAPANDVIPDPLNPGTLWTATDLGVFVTVNDGASWSMLGFDLPRVVVNHLAFDPVQRRLFAGTYGRSVFTFDVDELTAAPAAGLATLGRAFAPYPNPSADGSWIAWELARPAELSVEIYSVAGRKLWSRQVAADAGPGRLRWEGRDERGRELPSGVYLARLRAGGRKLGAETITLRR